MSIVDLHFESRRDHSLDTRCRRGTFGHSYMSSAVFKVYTGCHQHSLSGTAVPSMAFRVDQDICKHSRSL